MQSAKCYMCCLVFISLKFLINLIFEMPRAQGRITGPFLATYGMVTFNMVHVPFM